MFRVAKAHEKSDESRGHQPLTKTLQSNHGGHERGRLRRKREHTEARVRQRLQEPKDHETAEEPNAGDEPASGQRSHDGDGEAERLANDADFFFGEAQLLKEKR